MGISDPDRGLGEASQLGALQDLGQAGLLGLKCPNLTGREGSTDGPATSTLRQGWPVASQTSATAATSSGLWGGGLATHLHSSLCTHDLIPALQPPTGQEALPHFADDGMEAQGDDPRAGHLAWAQADTRGTQGSNSAGGMCS